MTSFEADEILVNKEWSGFGDVVIARRKNHLDAVCARCMLRLGWTWSVAGVNGYWSCIDGCRHVVANSQGQHTSSVYYFGGSLSAAMRSPSAWLSGWLGISEDEITVDIEGEF